MMRNKNKNMINDPGFGTRFSARPRRSINKDGSFNMVRHGGDGWLQNLYQHLVGMRTSHFLVMILVGYALINFLFAFFYFMIGAEHLIGVQGETPIGHFLDCFYFSTQTFTTVGYGAIAPRGIMASTVASLEALTGLLTFAIGTGLLYARFSKPTAHLQFSNQAILTPFQGVKAIMFRLANKRNNVLMDMNARLILVLRDNPADRGEARYFSLKPEIEQITFLPLTWTIVHKIDEESPLFGMTIEDLKENSAELLILITGFDDTFNQTIHSRYSYVADEIEENVRFVRAFAVDDEGLVQLHLEHIHRTEPVA